MPVSSKPDTYTQANGLAQNSVYSVYESRDGTVWAGTLSGGVSRFSDGKFTTYTIRERSGVQYRGVHSGNLGRDHVVRHSQWIKRPGE